MKTKAEVFLQLQNEVLSMQGFKPVSMNKMAEIGLGHINQSFPNRVFPLSGLHEFSCNNIEDAAASSAYITALLSSIMDKGAISLWISSKPTIFPPALQFFGVSPNQVIFVNLKNEREVSWAIEEALKCTTLAAVVGELSEMSFTMSRRFQLAIEGSSVPLFVLRCNPRNRATASLTRWQLRPLPSRLEAGLPGVGHPRWQVTLLKVRNGRPGVWNLEWIAGRFRHVSKLAVINSGLQRKTG